MTPRNNKSNLQCILRQQKKIAHTLSLISGYHTSETIYAWKTVHSLEKTIEEYSSSLHEVNLKELYSCIIDEII